MARAVRSLRFLLLWAFVAATGGVAQGEPGRTVVIGVDGMDHALTRRFLAEGDLPELAALAAEGTFAPLRSTNPAQSPVAWATITTGLDPGRTGVFDFLKRTLRDGEIGAELALVEKVERSVRVPACAALAALAGVVFLAARRFAGRGAPRRATALRWTSGLLLSVVGAAAALVPPTVVVPRNPRGGEALWERVDRAGVKGASLFAPLAFPAPALVDGCLLCGLGAPDAAQSPGIATLWREEPVPGGGIITPTGCRVSPLRADGDRLGPLFAEGPRDAAGRRVRSPVSALALRAKRQVEFRTTGGAATKGVGEWTPWLPASYAIAPFAKLHALTRFRVIEAGDRHVIYQEPACLDPLRQSPLAPVTSPRSFGGVVGGGRPFDTLGWACATNPLQDELIDEETFLSDVAELDEERSAMLFRMLEDRSRRLVFYVTATPDRVQHLFWRDHDPAHPRHDPELLRRRGDPIRESYRRVDRLVGKVRREHLRPGDRLFVLSDHGFASFRTAVNLNRWLAEEGYLVGEGAMRERNIEGDLGGGALFPGIDWRRTKAYSLGLGKIWINLAGREPGGSVRAEERDALLGELREKLLALRHDGRKVVRSARVREELYRGDRLGESADLVLGFEDGFRISWQATLGSLAEPVFAPNRARWSGDHCSVDPEIVPGVFFSDVRYAASFVDAADVFPTVEAALGLPPTAGLDGRSLAPAPK
jgi:predicted AlkP superfamily phosphohydrolase/phosphomutase